jgi:aldehyde:ferredoxin oxidoreductase
MGRNYGWAGKILRINLTDEKTSTIHTNPFIEKFLGGRGIAAKIAWDEIHPGIDAFDPQRDEPTSAVLPRKSTLNPGTLGAIWGAGSGQN